MRIETEQRTTNNSTVQLVRKGNGIITSSRADDAVNNIPEHAWGGNGKISVVELLRRATAHPRDCGLKLRSCCMKSLHSIRATSAKCKSHRIWFCNDIHTNERTVRKCQALANLLWSHCCRTDYTYFEATSTFLVRPRQIDTARVAPKTLLMVVIVLELGRGLRLRGRIKEGARCLHCHRVDGSVYNLRTRVPTSPITTETHNDSQCDDSPNRSRVCHQWWLRVRFVVVHQDDDNNTERISDDDDCELINRDGPGRRGGENSRRDSVRCNGLRANPLEREGEGGIQEFVNFVAVNLWNYWNNYRFNRVFQMIIEV